jgi:diadenylate cyclase
MDVIMEIFSNIRIMDVIDIGIVAFVFYKILMLIKETRAEQLIKGIIILVVMLKLSEWSKLYVVHYILMNTMTLGVVALLIVFQPELRRALEYIGRSKFLSKSMEASDEGFNSMVSNLVNAVISLSREKIGALIVIERETGLNEIIHTGVKIDGEVSSGLLINVFIPNTPLHDGAVIIRRDRLMAAGCFLPLSETQSISKELGTRHRAAIGIAEQSDAIVIVVSEETGTISVAMNGKLTRHLDVNGLTTVIRNGFMTEQTKPLLKKRWIFKDDITQKD